MANLFTRVTELDSQTRDDLMNEIKKNLKQLPNYEIENFEWDIVETKKELAVMQAQHLKLKQVEEFISSQITYYHRLLNRRETKLQLMISERTSMTHKSFKNETQNGDGSKNEKGEHIMKSITKTTEDTMKSIEMQQKKDSILLEKVSANHKNIIKNIHDMNEKIIKLESKMHEVTKQQGELEEFVEVVQKIQEIEDEHLNKGYDEKISIEGNDIESNSWA